MKKPRLLIEDWLPAAAIGVECMRERGSASALAPTTYLHVWWARRPLCASRAAVLGSLLPADFPHDVFERLLGFGKPGKELVRIRQLMDTGKRVESGFGCERAFKCPMREDDLAKARAAASRLFGKDIAVIDPMAGGGSIPLESARLGFRTLASEYNPVACTVLEATVDYPFRFGGKLAERTRYWAKEWLKRAEKRLAPFFPKRKESLVHAYIFARTVPCPDTEGHPHTPLVPDWHLLKPKDSTVRLWAEPVVDKKSGTWTVRIVDNREPKSRNKIPPAPTYGDGKGISLFSGHQIPADWIKAKAQADEMKSALYAIAVKAKGLKFEPPAETDFQALEKAEQELSKHRKRWEQEYIIPTERVPAGDKTREVLVKGMQYWADLFAPRQLLGFGVLVEELQDLHDEIVKTEGNELGEAVVHLLSFVIDKFLNYNNVLGSWHAPRSVIRSVFDRHDFAFKITFAEMAPCGSGAGFAWAIDNVLEAWENIESLPRSETTRTVRISLGSATNLPSIADKSLSAVVVDPPYADNVQYSELADFFYVWLKRTQGHRQPEWFSSYLCDHTEEAVVNISRHRADGEKAGNARRKANEFYQKLMLDVFKECRRILRDDGALTVMFTHKKQEAWEALFTSLVKAGFTITATWPVKTESEHSLHQAKKNAAQSTVILVARKRDDKADVGYFDAEMRREIRLAAQKTAERLMKDGLNPVDQLVGSFGPAMEVYSRHSEVRTDTGDAVGVDRALDEASEAVAAFRIQQLAARGLQGVEAEGRFYLLCWDVLQAAEFRFNEAHLLGKAVGMDVDTMIYAGLVSKSGDKIKILSAKDRRRAKKLEQEEMEETLFGPMPTGKKKRVKKGDVLKVHPNDPHFRTALDACHALALRYAEAGGGNPGLGSARQLATQQGWKGSSPIARLMEALLKAAPPALWFEKGKTSAAAIYPEFRAWHAMIEPLFGITPPEWIEEYVEPDNPLFASHVDESDEIDEEGDSEEGSES
jgi:adenine-specific DNA methylase